MGGILYALAHFFIINVFLFKILFIKLILIVLAFFGFYERHQTLAAVQPVCVNDQNLVPLSACEINFTSIKDAILYLENKLNIPQATIYDPIDYQILKETLNHYCPKNISQNIHQTIKDIIQNKRVGLPREKTSRLSALSKLFENYKNHIIRGQESTDTTDDFCKSKYIDYALINAVREDFLALLKKVDLLELQHSVFDSVSRKDDGILGSFLDGQIFFLFRTGIHYIDINNDDSYETYYKDGSYSQKIAKKIVQLSNVVINASLQNLKDMGVLDVSDINVLDDKINVHFVPDCKKIQGYSVIQQLINGTNKKIVGVNLKNMTLTINICFNYQYIQNLAQYVEDIFVHEIGHYVYFVKDTHSNSFDTLCRKNNKISCPKDTFLSKYAQSGPMEDYAESFLHRYLGDSATKKIYTGNYYSGNYYSGGYIVQTGSVLALKLGHFAQLF